MSAEDIRRRCDIIEAAADNHFDKAAFAYFQAEMCLGGDKEAEDAGHSIYFDCRRLGDKDDNFRFRLTWLSL